jgi:hypothetical protein
MAPAICCCHGVLEDWNAAGAVIWYAVGAAGVVFCRLPSAGGVFCCCDSAAKSRFIDICYPISQLVPSL